MIYKVYKITNILNGKCYVGQTRLDIETRWQYHLYESEYSRRKYKFYNAIRKYGEENFSIEILEYCSSLEMANELEMNYIKKFNSYYFGYNSTFGGDGVKKVSLSEEHKMKISISLKGKKKRYGHGEKVSQRLKGKKFTEEHKKNLRERWAKDKIEGRRIVSDETKNKMRIARVGKKQSEESIKKMKATKLSKRKYYNCIVCSESHYKYPSLKLCKKHYMKKYDLERKNDTIN